jgi:hypothetical protein
MISRSLIARISILLVIAFGFLSIAPGASGVSSFTQYLCNGSPQGSGIIPAQPVIGTGSIGVTSVVGLTIIIMIAMFLVMGAIYVIGDMMGLPSLKNMMKTEVAEMMATSILIAVFFGAFFVASFASVGGVASQSSTANPTLHFNGPARSVFVADCIMISNTSTALLFPIFTSGVISYGIDFVDSVNLKITPGGFGFTDSPLTGLSIIGSTLTELSELLSAFVFVLLSINLLLGMIYAAFPIFLYLGIVFRAFPWTRALGGIFIAIFIGFYVVFPLMINATVGGFSAATYNEVSSGYYNSASANGISSFTSSSSANNINTVAAQSGAFGSFPSMVSYVGGTLYSLVGFPGGYGILNGFIADFMGPPIMVMIELAFSFIIALDFADILSDILGAPSLQTERLMGKLL